MNELNNQWKCEQCGTMNSGNYCISCGALKPVEVKKEEEPQPVISEKQEEPAVTTASKPAEPKVSRSEPKAQHISPVLTALMAGVIGLGAGFGGGYLAVKQYAPKQETPIQESVTPALAAVILR